MTQRQCEIAAEAYATSLFAQCGYDVLVQYGANQPDYDLIAVKGNSKIPISVKGSQDGGWMLAVKYKTKGVGYHQAIDKWLANQRNDVIFVFVQFINLTIGSVPRVYLAKPKEIAAHLKTQCDNRGHCSLQEDYRRDHPKSKYNHKISATWSFSATRAAAIIK